MRRADFFSSPLVATSSDLLGRLGGIASGDAGPDDAMVDYSLRAGCRRSGVLPASGARGPARRRQQMSAGRALVLAPRVPEFDRESGLLRVSHLIEMLVARDWEVTFGCVRTPRGSGWERYVHELEQRGVETHAPLRSVDAIRDVGRAKLAVLAFWHVADQSCPSCEPPRRPRGSSSTRSMSTSSARSGTSCASSPDRLPASLSRHGDAFMRELNAYAAADAVLTVSSKEASLINDLVGQPGLALSLPDTEELPRSPVSLHDRRGILFLGNFQHAPNRDAAAYLFGEIAPASTDRC